MKTKLIKSIALVFLTAIIVFNITVISTRNESVTFSINSLEAQATCYSGEGISGYIGLMRNAQCYYGNLGSGSFVSGCEDADSTCSL